MESSHGHCLSPIACNDNGRESELTLALSSELIVQLEPREYFLAVDGLEASGDFGLRVSLDEIACTTNDTCEDAIELDPSFGERVVPVDFVCARSSRSTSCDAWNDEADVYYRLDLSGHDGPVRVRASMPWGYALALLRSSAGGQCETELGCLEESIDLTLKPDAYYIMVSASRDAPRREDLSLAIDPRAPGELKACIDEEIATCADDSKHWPSACCSSSARGCLQTYSGCGLDPGAHGCVCDIAPECCDVSSTMGDCMPIYIQCGLFCSDLDFSAFCEAQSS
jgi:hypothetical protein